MDFSRRKIWFLLVGLLLVIGFTSYTVVFTDSNQFLHKVGLIDDREFTLDDRKARPLVSNKFIDFNTPEESIKQKLTNDKNKKYT